MSNIGNVYIADQNNNRIRQVTVSTGIVTTIAGTGAAPYSGDDGVATSATFNGPRRVALDASGRTLYHCLLHCYTVIRALRDAILDPWITIPTPNLGNVYIADQYNNRIRKVTVSTGIITTIAGTGGGSYSSDNGAATSSDLYSPIGVAVDASGTIIASVFMPHFDLV